MSQKCNCFEDVEKRGEKFVNVRNSLSFMSKIVYLHEQIFGVLVPLSFRNSFSLSFRFNKRTENFLLFDAHIRTHKT